ncbi:30S ribosomal protein S3 [Candidatus Gottesmanbacteria bacterium]|nr:30S ribosomal protein S3 [Candidatus Gottesmanbacteria bacterium]MBI5452255.1 30S ribosomal protein S3 [Candidatus Gottesmanbacteria bacterium]
MGQKINPKGFRLGPLYTWESRWFAGPHEYKNYVVEDAKLRQALLKKLQPAGIVKVEIERSINKINIILHVVRPGMVIGRGGSGMEIIKKFIVDIIFAHAKSIGKVVKAKDFRIDVRVEPVKEPYLAAFFVASQIAEQLARRLPHKRVVSFALEKVKTAGAKGVKIALAGRIGGAEISRRETFKFGSIPLSTIREDVDFAAIPSLTKSGYIGVKVWICKKI